MQPTSSQPTHPSSNAKPRTESFLIREKHRVIRDERSGARCISFPFDFNDETVGTLIICRIDDRNWEPLKDISEVIIKFK